MAQKRVKDYSYIKRSDISVLKATIDGKVMNVDPKKILSGTYVAGKVKPTAKKLRVAKIDPFKLKEKIFAKAKELLKEDYEAEYEKFVLAKDLKAFIECGLTEEMIMAFYLGFKAVVEVSCGGEYADYGKIDGIFYMRTDGGYIERAIERAIYNCENKCFELGFKYPDFDWKKAGMKVSKTEVVETPEYENFMEEKVQDILKVETFTVKTNFKVLAVKSVGKKKDGKIVESSAYGTSEERDPKKPLQLNGGYLALVSRNAKDLFALAKKLLSQPKSYVKDFDWLIQTKTDGAASLNEIGFKYAKGGKVRVLKDIDNSYYKDNPKKGDILIVRDLKKDINYWETEDDKIPESVTAWFGDRGNEYMLGEEVEFVDEGKLSKTQYFAKGGGVENSTPLIIYYADGERQVFTDKTYKMIREDLADMYPLGHWTVTDSHNENSSLQSFAFEEFKNSPTYSKNLSGFDLWKEFTIYRGQKKKYDDGGMIEINEDGSNLPKPLYDLFSEWDEDADPYLEAERMRERAKEIGFEFDYDLSGAPTEFRAIKMAKGGYIGDYYSSTEFVEKHNLQDKAKKLFGNDWEQGGDYSFDNEEIEMLLEDEGNYKVEYKEDENDKDGEGRIYVTKMAHGGGVHKANAGAYIAIAEKAKGLAPKTFDAADTKVANRIAKKSFMERMSETGNEEYDRDAYQANTEFSKGGSTYAKGGEILDLKKELKKLENKDLRKALLDFYNDFHNNYISNYLDIPKESYAIDSHTNKFVLLRDTPISKVEQERLRMFINPYFNKNAKPLFAKYFNTYDVVGGQIIIDLNDVYAEGGNTKQTQKRKLMSMARERGIIK